MRSCRLAGQTIMLAAKAMGYDSCQMIGFDAVQVAELIRLPEDYVIGAVGKATRPAWPKPGQLPLDEVIIHNHFAWVEEIERLLEAAPQYGVEFIHDETTEKRT